MPISGIIVTNHHSPYPLSKNIAILVFPTLLQKQIHLREVFTFYVRYPAETGSTNTLFPIRHINFIVKLHSDRFLGKGNTGIQHLLRILCALNRLMHFPQKHRTCGKYCDINNTQYFYAFHTGIHTGTVAIATLLGKH